jgi:hypothetical protein
MNFFLIAKYEESHNNYYHFLIGYLLPVVDTLSNNIDKDIKYVVRDCGLMNTWFKKLKNFYNIEVMNSEQFLIESLKSKNKVTFDYYDDRPYFFDKPKIKEILEKLKMFYNIEITNKKNIGVLTRDFAKTNISLFTKNHNKPRFIENTKDLIDSINNNIGTCIALDTSEDSCESVIKTYGNLKILIGQWGAGLTNMLWMPPNSTIIQIISYDELNAKLWETCYKDFAELLDHNFVSIEAQETWTGPVNIEKILDCLEK